MEFHEGESEGGSKPEGENLKEGVYLKTDFYMIIYIAESSGKKRRGEKKWKEET